MRAETVRALADGVTRMWSLDWWRGGSPMFARREVERARLVRGLVSANGFRVGDGVRQWVSFYDPIRVAARAEAGASLATGAMLIA